MKVRKIFRDPVHDIITFHTPDDQLLIELINTPEFLRLKRIRQLGLAWLVFPGAEHSRFSHMLGVCHVATRMIEELKAKGDLDRADCPQDMGLLTRVAALLHDLGHGPFSHLFESVFDARARHEYWTAQIIRSPDTEVHRLLAATSSDLPDRVADFFEYRTVKPRLFLYIVSSQLDADRFDYLLRDSLMTGTRYGLFDLEWMLSSLRAGKLRLKDGEEKVLLIDGSKGLPTVEQHLLGRHFMYQMVCFHKTARSAEMMMRSIFKRLARLGQDGKLGSEVPVALRKLCAGELPTVQEYLELDDFQILSLLRHWAGSASVDGILGNLCDRLLKRNLFKHIDGSTDESGGIDFIKSNEIQGRAEEATRKAGFDPEYYFAVDQAGDVCYKDMVYFLGRAREPEDIWVVREGEDPAPITDPRYRCDALRALADQKRQFLRFYVPDKETREKVVKGL